MSYEPVPPVWYGRADVGDAYDGGMSNSYHFTRAQFTLKANDGGTDYVLIAKIIFDSFSDFCGGFVARSPQVNTFRPGGWGDEEYFYSAGVGRAFEQRLTWNALRDGSFPCPSLNTILGKDAVQIREAEEWAWHQLALAMVSFSWFSGRRLIHCNGNKEGSMHKVVQKLRAHNEAHLPAPTWFPQVHGLIGGPNHNGVCSSNFSLDTFLWSACFHETGFFTNNNSGRACNAWSIIMDYERRNDWDEDEDDTEVGAPMSRRIATELIGPYTSAAYTLALTRPLWRNG